MNNNKIKHEGKPTHSLLPYETNPSRRILVVEDDEAARLLNTAVLIDSGYKVDAAEDGAAAWDALQLNDYDLMVTDNHMPKVSGVDLLKKLHAARMALPVIMVTGMMPTEELNRQPWLQIQAALLKPYSVPEFLNTVRNVLFANDGARDEIAPPYWQNQAPVDGLQFG